eukprot:GHVN01000804.1.p1 GENE.GHVN01000804.1~~GHVN01000804.1.p1  ORF type:complete len:499 (-),score=31.67 GHVN01000804.1:1836-3332(-)
MSGGMQDVDLESGSSKSEMILYESSSEAQLEYLSESEPIPKKNKMDGGIRVAKQASNNLEAGSTGAGSAVPFQSPAVQTPTFGGTNGGALPVKKVSPVPRRTRRQVAISTTAEESDDPRAAPKRVKRKRASPTRTTQPLRRRTSVTSTGQEQHSSASPASSPELPPSPPPSSPSREPHRAMPTTTPPVHRTARPVRECRISAANKAIASPLSVKMSGSANAPSSKDKDVLGGKKAIVQGPGQPSAGPSLLKKGGETDCSRALATSSQLPTETQLTPAIQRKLSYLEPRLAFMRSVEDYLGLVERMYFPHLLPSSLDKEHAEADKGGPLTSADPCLFDKIIYDLVVEDNPPHSRRPYHEAVDVEARRRKLANHQVDTIQPQLAAFLGRRSLRGASTPFISTKSETATSSFASVTALEFLVSPVRKKQILDSWAPLEVAKFQAAVCSYGKRFHEIAQVVGTKSPHDCIDFYYQIWKLSSRYKSWKAHRYESEYLRDLAGQ